MIQSFACADTERLFHRKRPKRLPRTLHRPALRKLQMLHNSQTLQDLRIPPANHLESLKGDRKGRHSIRINDQYRICFRWQSGDAFDVEIVDYH